MSLLDFEKVLFRLHPEKLAPRIKELVGLAEKEALHELHPAVAALSHTEAVPLQAASEHRLHALTTSGMARPAALESTAAALEKASINAAGPFDIVKLPTPQTSSIPPGINVHPVVDHVVGHLRSGSNATEAFQEAAQMSPDVLKQLKDELKAAQHEMFSSGDFGQKIRAHRIDEFLATLVAGELIPKKGVSLLTNEPRPYRGPPVRG